MVDEALSFLANCLRVSNFFRNFAVQTINNKMRQILSLVILGLVLTMLAACQGKKKSDDIIAPRVVKAAPKAPVRMQEYTDERDVSWIGKTYHVAIHRQPADSMAFVKDETGQKYVDNMFTLSVSRADGSVFYSRTFNKSDMGAYLDDDYRQTGVFEGLVFDKPDGDWLVFAASVGHPQTDEYIPLIIRLSRMGELVILRDVQMDTNAPAEEEEV